MFLVVMRSSLWGLLLMLLWVVHSADPPEDTPEPNEDDGANSVIDVSDKEDVP